MIIEYRAWDKKRKIIVGESYPDNWDSDKDEYWGDWVKLEISGISSLNENSGFEVMQYTNKQDSSGKKIFQGDFVWQKRKDNCFGGKNDEEICLIGEPEY